jgi:hypothetical protein
MGHLSHGQCAPHARQAANDASDAVLHPLVPAFLPTRPGGLSRGALSSDVRGTALGHLPSTQRRREALGDPGRLRYRSQSPKHTTPFPKIHFDGSRDEDSFSRPHSRPTHQRPVPEVRPAQLLVPRRELPSRKPGTNRHEGVKMGHRCSMNPEFPWTPWEFDRMSRTIAVSLARSRGIDFQA